MPVVKGGGGKYVKTVDAAERRRLAAELRATGATWKVVADTYYRGNQGNATAGVKQFWAEQPKETVEEIRSTMLAKIDALEQEVRQVMARRHYVVAEGRIVRNHGEDCALKLGESHCRCPKLEDDKPVYEGVDRVRALVETQLKLIPGLAAATKLDTTVQQTVTYSVGVTSEELEQL